MNVQMKEGNRDRKFLWLKNLLKSDAFLLTVCLAAIIIALILVA